MPEQLVRLRIPSSRYFRMWVLMSQLLDHLTVFQQTIWRSCVSKLLNYASVINFGSKILEAFTMSGQLVNLRSMFLKVSRACAELPRYLKLFE